MTEEVKTQFGLYNSSMDGWMESHSGCIAYIIYANEFIKQSSGHGGHNASNVPGVQSV